MVLKLEQKSEVLEATIKALGLDPNQYDIISPEVISSAIRRAASIKDSCTSSILRKIVEAPLSCLVDNPDDLRELIDNIVETLIAVGDLIEITDQEKRTIIYASPPSFVQRKSGSLIILGSTPDFTPFLTPEMESQLVYKNHIRLLFDKDRAVTVDTKVEICDQDGKYSQYTITTDELIKSSSGYISHSSPIGKGLLGHIVGDIVNIATPSGNTQMKIINIAASSSSKLVSELRQLGLIEIVKDKWIYQPVEESPKQYLDKYERALSQATFSGEIPDLKILDHRLHCEYYKKRWVNPTNHDGHFLARRPQRYGADLWCYIELAKGQPVKFIDLPIFTEHTRAWDEAWRLQMGIDAYLGHPQRFTVQRGQFNTILKFFAPLPSWIRRRWAVIGDEFNANDCLLAYSFDNNECDEEIGFAAKSLWLIPV